MMMTMLLMMMMTMMTTDDDDDDLDDNDDDDDDDDDDDYDAADDDDNFTKIMPVEMTTKTIGDNDQIRNITHQFTASSQRSPVKPSGHLHLRDTEHSGSPSTSLRHWPPFLHLH